MLAIKMLLALGKDLSASEDYAGPNYTVDLREGVAVEYISCEPTKNKYDIYNNRLVPKHRAAK